MPADYGESVARRDPQKKRQSLLIAAAEDILEYGYAGSSLSSTAARIGLTKGAFSYHFPTKQDLVSAMMAISAERLAEVDETAGALYSEGGLREYLVYDRLVGELFQSDVLMQALNVMMFDPTTPRELADSTLRDWNRRYRRYLEAARRLGELDLSPELIDETVDYLILLSLGAGFMIGQRRLDPVGDYGYLRTTLRGLGVELDGVADEVVGRIEEWRRSANFR